jgi:hypothetical protein
MHEIKIHLIVTNSKLANLKKYVEFLTTAESYIVPDSSQSTLLLPNKTAQLP